MLLQFWLWLFGIEKKKKVFYLPTLDALVDKANNCAQSCRFVEQLQINDIFFKSTVERGLDNKSYKPSEAEKILVILDHIFHTRLKTLQKKQS